MMKQLPHKDLSIWSVFKTVLPGDGWPLLNNGEGALRRLTASLED